MARRPTLPDRRQLRLDLGCKPIGTLPAAPAPGASLRRRVVAALEEAMIAADAAQAAWDAELEVADGPRREEMTRPGRAALYLLDGPRALADMYDEVSARLESPSGARLENWPPQAGERWPDTPALASQRTCEAIRQVLSLRFPQARFIVETWYDGAWYDGAKPTAGSVGPSSRAER